MSSRDTLLYLEDINSSINKINKYVKGLSFNDFKSNGMIVDAVVRNLEIVGEAANNISREFKSQNSQIPWKDMIEMRNKVVHEYFGVDSEILWQTIKEDLPGVKKEINKFI